MAKTYWKCLNEGCQDENIYPYKGLCRQCSIYVEGKVTEPIQRVRVTSEGTVYIAPERVEPLFRGPITRRQQKEWSAQLKAEKKHRIALRRAKRMMRDNPVPEEHQEELDALVVENIGEQVHDCCAQDTCSHRQEEE